MGFLSVGSWPSGRSDANLGVWKSSERGRFVRFLNTRPAWSILTYRYRWNWPTATAQ